MKNRGNRRGLNAKKDWVHQNVTNHIFVVVVTVLQDMKRGHLTLTLQLYTTILWQYTICICLKATVETIKESHEKTSVVEVLLAILMTNYLN